MLVRDFSHSGTIVLSSLANGTSITTRTTFVSIYSMTPRLVIGICQLDMSPSPYIDFKHYTSLVSTTSFSVDTDIKSTGFNSMTLSYMSVATSIAYIGSNRNIMFSGIGDCTIVSLIQ